MPDPVPKPVAWPLTALSYAIAAVGCLYLLRHLPPLLLGILTALVVANHLRRHNQKQFQKFQEKRSNR